MEVVIINEHGGEWLNFIKRYSVKLKVVRSYFTEKKNYDSKYCSIKKKENP